MTERKHRLMVGVMVFTLFLWGISGAGVTVGMNPFNLSNT